MKCVKQKLQLKCNLILAIPFLVLNILNAVLYQQKGKYQNEYREQHPNFTVNTLEHRLFLNKHQQRTRSPTNTKHPSSPLDKYRYQKLF